MITYNINRFIHTVLRENKLIYLMELIINEDKKQMVLFEDFIKQLKRFLKKENELLFNENKLKYLIFMDDFKKNIENISDLKNKDSIEINSVLLNLYEIPKKRNNLFLVFLFYFFIKNRNHLGGKEIFNIIYIYFVIIVYRVRLTKEKRESLLRIDKTEFMTFKEIVGSKIKNKSKKYPFLKPVYLKRAFVVILLTFFSMGSFGISSSYLKSDINAADSTFGKVAFDSIMIGRVSDPIMTSIKNFGFQNLLLIVAFALLVQSFKTSLSTIFFNSLLTKVFHILWTIIKFAGRIIFYVYDYMTYKLETRLIFLFISKIVEFSILPGCIMFFFFLSAYVCIYFLVIFLYLKSILFITGFSLSIIYILMICSSVTLLIIYFNFHNNILNFKTFLIEMEAIAKNIYDESKKVKA